MGNFRLWQKIQQLQTAIAEGERAKESIALLIEEIKESIAKGEKTGNPTLDHFISNGVFDASMMMPLYFLQRRIKGNERKLFIVSMHGKLWNWGYYAGVLSGEELVFCEGECGIPTKEFIKIDGARQNKPGPLWLSCRGIPTGDPPVLQAEVIIGDEEISRFEPKNMDSNTWKLHLSLVARDIGRSIKFTF